MPAFAPVDSPLPPVVGAALAVDDDVAIVEIDDDAVWLPELVIVDKEVGVDVAVAPI